MDAPDMSGRSHLRQPGPDDPGLPDFAAFRAARERFLRGLEDSRARIRRDGARHRGAAQVLDLDEHRRG